MLRRINNINTHIAVLILFFLVNVSFLASFSQSIYFLLNFQRSLTITLIGYVSVIIMYMFYLYKENFLRNYLSLLQNSIVLNYSEKCINLLENLSPNKLWFLIHGYFNLSILHVLMYSYFGIDILFESLYQGFNIIRLAFFPIAILLYIYKMIPTELETLANAQTTKKLGQAAAEIATNPGKNPRAAAVLFGGTLVVAAVKANGQNRKEQLEESKKIINTNEVDPELVADPANTGLREAFIEKVNVDTLCTSSSAKIAFQDLKGLFLPGHKTVGTRIEETTRNLKIENVLAEGARARAQTLGYPIATRIPHSTDKVDLPTASTAITPPSSIPNSVVEWPLLDVF